MRDLARLGIGPDALGPLPELSHQARTAAHCWHFCEGWNPDRWPIYAALYPVDDWHAIVELMQALRAEERAAREKQTTN